jgi:hypothetical protein
LLCGLEESGATALPGPPVVRIMVHPLTARAAVLDRPPAPRPPKTEGQSRPSRKPAQYRAKPAWRRTIPVPTSQK